MDNYGKIRNILVFVLVLNWVVAFLKVIVGHTIKSASMLSDGYHSFSDGASNIIGIIGISVAVRPKDAQHPYGHKKYETFTAILIAALLFIIAFHIIHDTLERFRTPHSAPQATAYGFGVMLLTLAINVTVMAYEYRMGKKLNSDILVADSFHTRSDILTSLAVIGSLVGVKIGYPILDPLCSLIIALCIAYTAFTILSSSSKVLCDTAIVDIRNIEAIVNGIDGVIECHNIRTRGRADDIYLDLHVLVNKDMPVAQADTLSDKIEEEIKAKLRGVSDVVVHMEPDK